MRKSGGKSSKFIPLNVSDIAQERILLPGRHPCTCEASRHELINNCLDCGRIVCAQEGSGACFTCNNLVCTEGEKAIIRRQSKTSYKLLKKLMPDSDNISACSAEDKKLQLALDHRDKLLEFDRNIEKRTKVIDDENDYFQLDSQWLSERERKILQKKKNEIDDLLHNKRNQKFTLDFAGRRVVKENPSIKFDVDELLKPDSDSIVDKSNVFVLGEPIDIHIEYQDAKEPMYHPPTYKNEDVEKRTKVRIQDKELQEMSDEGHCLSLHQPYASLLIAGIKKHEGRIWYTSYRGRLWIHAAGKIITKGEIEDIEKIYRYNDGTTAFPKRYPSGCLLGCVDLVDCLPQDDYRDKFPKGESASPYVFICENAQELNLKIPMKGKHKVFTLESNILQAAKKTLRKNI